MPEQYDERGTLEHVDHRAEAAWRAKPQILPAIGMVPPLAVMPFHLPLRSLQPGFAAKPSLLHAKSPAKFRSKETWTVQKATQLKTRSSGASHQTTERCSAFLLVLDCATSIMKLEKLKLKQKNESNCVQVGGHRFSVLVVVRRVLLNLMNKFSIQHSSRRMQNVDCSCSDFKHFNLAFHSLPVPSKLLTLHDCRSRTCSSNQQKLALSRAVAAADAPACMARQKLLRGGCSNKTPMIKCLNTHIHLCDSKCGGKFSQLDLFSFFEEFKVSTFLEARFTGFLTHIETCPCMH